MVAFGDVEVNGPDSSQYITEKNKDESVPDPGPEFYWSFVAAH
jgi:hypothetical protein